MGARRPRFLQRSAFPLIALLATVARPAGAEPDAARLVGPFTREDYPQTIIDRPLTLPAGMIEAEVGVQFTSVRFGTPVLGVGGTDDWDADYALSDQNPRPDCDRGLVDTRGCRKRRLCTIARRFFGLTALSFTCTGCGA